MNPAIALHQHGFKALARVAWAAFLDAARSISETGSFELLASAVPFATLSDIFDKRD